MNKRHRLLGVFLSFLILFLSRLSAASDGPAVKPTVVTIDAAPARPFPHFWEKMFGSLRKERGGTDRLETSPGGAS